MTAVLADLAIESWASTAAAIRLADLMQHTQRGADPGELPSRSVIGALQQLVGSVAPEI